MMHQFLPSRARRRRGIVAILVAFLLIALIGVTAIALDGGMLQDSKRKVQNGADAAALAAVNILYKNYPSLTLTTPDPGTSAKTAALNNASANGFPNDGTTSTVTVNIPPSSGPFQNKMGYAEVIITYNQPRYFSTIWGSSKLNVQARAVAWGFWGGTGNGVIVLDPVQQYALDSSGNGSVRVTGGAAMIVDSNNPSAARATGGGSLIADNFRITGGYTGTLTGNVQTGTTPIPDPLAYLPVPSVPPDGIMTQTSLTQGNHRYVLTPGRYHNLPNFNPGDVVVLKQASAGNNGIFYIDGGGFNSSGASIIMDQNTSGGVMIYNNPTSGASSMGIQITGNSSGTVNLSGLTSGPYAGILMWQQRSSAVGLSVSGQGNFTMNGTFYAANANMQITGQGDATIGSQYISRTLSLSGGGNIRINYTDDGTARKRVICLVE